MDLSPERVLDFGPRTHRGIRWAKGGRTNLLWPVRAWRVVTPEPGHRTLNILERVVLRLHESGTHGFAAMGELLGLDAALMTIVTGDLQRAGALNELGEPTDRAREMLEDAVFESGDMRVGWVFQDTWSGALLPRFVTTLSLADAELDEDGKAWISSGTKGNPRRDWAFVQLPGRAPALPPTAEDIIDAARRHVRHSRRRSRAREAGDAVPAEAVQRVALVSDEPIDHYLLTYVYVPETPEIGGEQWYVADPFGFGASPALRDQLVQIRERADGGLREVLDRITGQRKNRAREQWLEMRSLLEDDAREEISIAFPIGDSDVPQARQHLIAAAAELAELENDPRPKQRVDAIYLRLRQSLEEALAALLRHAPPGDAWRKLYRDERAWLHRDACVRILTRCASAVGFAAQIPKLIASANPGTMRYVARSGNAASLRPACGLLVLAAADDTHHPFRHIASSDSTWIANLETIASLAGAEVHGGCGVASSREVREHLHTTIRLCRQVAESMSLTTEHQD